MKKKENNYDTKRCNKTNNNRIQSNPTANMFLFKHPNLCPPPHKFPSPLNPLSSSPQPQQPSYQSHLNTSTQIIDEHESITWIVMKICLFYIVKVGLIVTNLFVINCQIKYFNVCIGIAGAVVVCQAITLILSKFSPKLPNPSPSSSPATHPQKPSQHSQQKQQNQEQTTINYINKSTYTTTNKKNVNTMNGNYVDNLNGSGNMSCNGKTNICGGSNIGNSGMWVSGVHKSRIGKSRGLGENGQEKLLHVLWHLVLVCNVSFIVFSISSTLQPILSTNVFKLRGCLYATQFFSILTCSFLIQTPIPTLTLFIKYKLSQQYFLKYLLLIYTIGSFFDYLSFGISNLGWYNVAPFIVGSVSEQFFNFVSFYLSLLVLLGVGIGLGCGKVGVVGRVREFLELE